MNFDFSEEQEAVRDAAATIFEGRATPERVKAVEATEDRFDRELWAELAKANLLGVCLPEEHGGSGLGLIELCLLLELQGRAVAPLPLVWTLVSAMAIAEFGTAEQQARWLPGVIAGDVVLTAALNPGLVSVPAAPFADRVLVPSEGRLQLAEVRSERAVTTDRSVVGHVTVASGETLGDDTSVRWLMERMLVGLCALQVGVAEAALAQAAAYTSTRQQFGKPLSTFQGVAHKAADAYIDTEAMRVTLWQAAWRLAEGRDATKEVLVAKWWAAEAGQRVVHSVQHLHGGIGADIDYPVHRYFLWGKQLEVTLGGASETLARLGRVLAEASA